MDETQPKAKESPSDQFEELQTAPPKQKIKLSWVGKTAAAIIAIWDYEIDSKTNPIGMMNSLSISDHQQSWGYEDGPWKGPGPPLLVAADYLHTKSSVSRTLPMKFKSM